MKMANYDGILMLLAITNCLLVGVNGNLLNTFEDLVVMPNDSIQLSCRSDIKAEIQWFHRGEYLYAGGRFYAQNKDRFRMDTDINDQASRTYTLVIREARHEDAGVYSCREDEGRGNSSSANLTVMNTRLLCESNMHANGYIGPNICKKQEFMTFSCSVSFNGASPRLVWRASNDNSQPINSSVCDHQPNRVNCQLTLTSDPSYDGTFFTCLTAQTSGTQYNCSTEVIKVQSYPCKAVVVVLVIAIIAILIFIGVGYFVFKRFKITRRPLGNDYELQPVSAGTGEGAKDEITKFEKLLQPPREIVLYAENPKWVKTIATKASRELKREVYGIAILKDKLFAVSRKCKEIEVYELDDLKRSEEIAPKVHQIEDLENPRDMVSCSVNNCLYIRNYKEVEKRTEILRISPTGEVELKWVVKENTGQLSVGNDGNVIVAVWNGSKVMEYTCDGQRLREIQISEDEDASIDSLRHVISLQSGYFALCHGEDKNHRICIIEDHGRLIKSFGSTPGSSETQVNRPAHLARDRDDAIIVADRKNQRVLLLTPQLEFKRELLGEKDGLVNPWRVCLDMEGGFLLVADNVFLAQTEDACGRIHVYNYKIIK